MFFQILGSIAEFEHALMSERPHPRWACRRPRPRPHRRTEPELTPRQAKIAQQMYEETGPDGRLRYTVEQIAAESGVTRPTIHRHLANLPAGTPTSWIEPVDGRAPARSVGVEAVAHSRSPARG